MKRTLLIVDDDLAIRDAYGLYFMRLNYEVLTAGDAQEAMECLAGRTVPLCLLDLALPGTDGVALCREIKALNPMTTCVAMTGQRSLFEIAECRAAGFEDYFTKPVALDTLREMADRVFTRLERWKRT